MCHNVLPVLFLLLTTFTGNTVDYCDDGVDWFGWLVLHFFSNITALLSVIWLVAGRMLGV
jgi:hypothetical protein